jgi:polysaccharide chain length determinant protein (PEP-CTERM system associated)
MLGHRTLIVEDYVSILKRRGWLVLVPLIIAPILAVAISYTVPPQYLSQTLVLVQSQKVPDALVKPVISSDLDSRLASMKEQILSRSSLQPIIDRYGLYANSGITMDERIDRARKNIDIKTITSEISHSGGLPGFFISFKADDARTAQLVCGEITSLFLAENLRERSSSAEGTVTFLESQLGGAKRALDEQDAKLATFQQQYMGRLPSEEGTNSSMLTSLNSQLDAATQALSRMQQDKAFAESMLAQQTAASTPDTSGQTFGAPPSEAQLELQTAEANRASLLTHYTPDYPDVQAVDRRISELKRQIAHTSSVAHAPGAAPVVSNSAGAQQLRAQIQAQTIGIAAKRKEQEQVEAQINSYQGRLEASPIVEEQYKQLTRDNQTAQQFYDDLLAKINTSKMATDLEERQEGEQFRVMDAANLPDSPFSPKRGVFLIAGLGLGLVLGLIWVAFLEYHDTSLRNERDIWSFTQLPTLAIIGFAESVPHVKKPSALFRMFFRRRRSSEPYPAVSAD